MNSKDFLDKYVFVEDEKIKIEGNKNAHTMEIIHNPEKIKGMRDAITEYSALLCRIINRINRNNVV